MRRTPLSFGRQRGMVPRAGRMAARLRGIALTAAVTVAGSLTLSATGAQAVVVDMNQTSGQPAQLAGVQMVPGTQGQLTPAGVSTVTSPTSCADPEPGYFHWSDFTAPSTALCWHGGGV